METDRVIIVPGMALYMLDNLERCLITLLMQLVIPRSSSAPLNMTKMRFNTVTILSTEDLTNLTMERCTKASGLKMV